MGLLSGEERLATEWLWEGFTRYYGYRLAYDAGMLPAKEYVELLNQDLRLFPETDDSGFRGRVIGLWLDSAIRRESRGKRSLDDVMFDLVRGHQQPMTLVRVFDTINRYLSPNAQADLRRAVLNHGDLAAPDSVPVLGSCSSLSIEPLPTFDIGFDVDVSRAVSTVTGVAPEGPAFAAGLRDGQALTGVSYSKGQPERPATITIRTSAGVQRITYLPQGKAVTVSQYHVVPNKTCR
jgi:predicted metalloprotease with PDZ domain